LFKTKLLARLAVDYGIEVNPLCPINEVTIRRAGWMRDCLRIGKPYRH